VLDDAHPNSASVSLEEIDSHDDCIILINVGGNAFLPLLDSVFLQSSAHSELWLSPANAPLIEIHDFQINPIDLRRCHLPRIVRTE
jgi:uncharacterized membrane protein